MQTTSTIVLEAAVQGVFSMAATLLSAWLLNRFSQR